MSDLRVARLNVTCTLAAPGGGAENIGEGAGEVFSAAAPSGVLQLRTLAAGAGVAIATAGDVVTFSAEGAAGVAGANIGGASGAFFSAADPPGTLRFRTLQGGTGLTVAVDGDKVAATPYPVIGTGASAAASGVAFGISATAAGASGAALGPSASAAGASALAAGHSSSASAEKSTALGWGAAASGINGAALGPSAVASGLSSLAAGAATASGIDSLAFGRAAAATTTDAVAVGAQSAAGGLAALAAGYRAVASAEYATAAGNQAQALGPSSYAAGSQALARNSGSVAIGDRSAAQLDDAVAMGRLSSAGGAQSLALGASADANGTAAVALGSGAKARIPSTSVLAGALLLRRAAGAAVESAFRAWAGATIQVATGLVDLSAAPAAYSIAVPAGALFFPTALSVIGRGAPAAGPATVSAGDASDAAAFAAAFATDGSHRHFAMPLAFAPAATSLKVTVSAAAPGPAFVRFVWHGVFIEDEPAP